MKEIALNILDIIRNSVRAGAKNILVEVKESDQSNSMVVKVIDDGKGIDPEFLKNVDDPYTTSRETRKVGMGIPLLKQHVEMTGGSFWIESEVDKGTILQASFVKDHIDRQPLGDICGIFKMMLVSEESINFGYAHITDKGEFKLSTQEAKEILEVENFRNVSLASEVTNVLRENLLDIGAEIT